VRALDVPGNRLLLSARAGALDAQLSPRDHGSFRTETGLALIPSAASHANSARSSWQRAPVSTLGSSLAAGGLRAQMRTTRAADGVMGKQASARNWAGLLLVVRCDSRLESTVGTPNPVADGPRARATSPSSCARNATSVRRTRSSSRTSVVHKAQETVPRRRPGARRSGPFPACVRRATACREPDRRWRRACICRASRHHDDDGSGQRPLLGKRAPRRSGTRRDRGRALVGRGAERDRGEPATGRTP
jgi:hypothetical protein